MKRCIHSAPLGLVCLLGLGPAACTDPLLNSLPKIPEPNEASCDTTAGANSLSVTVFADHMALAWESEAGPSYQTRIERSSGAGFADLGAILDGDARTYDDTTALCSTPNQTCSYRVVVYKDACRTPASNIAESIPFPAAPAQLSAVTEGDNGTDVLVTWQDTNDNETGYRVERSAAGTASYTVLATVTDSGADTGGNLNYTDSDVGLDQRFDYRVVAFREYPNSRVGEAVSVATVEAYSTPLAPTGLTATGISSTQIDLSWTNQSAMHTGIEVRRAGGIDQSFAVLGSVAPTSISYTDNPSAPTLVADTEYTYEVVARIDAEPIHLASAADTAVAWTLPVVLASPAIAILSGEPVLSWTNANPSASIEVERRAGTSGVFAAAVTLSAGATTYADTSAPLDTQVFYRLWASNAAGESAVVELDVWTPPQTPTDLVLESISVDQIDIGWADVATTETGYRIEREETAGSGTFVTLITLGQNATSYSDDGTVLSITSDAEYAYRVIAVGNDADSTALSGQQMTRPQPVQAVTATVSGPDTIELSWEDYNFYESGFILQRDGVALPGYSGSGVTFVDDTVSLDTQYVYTVYAVNSGGWSQAASAPQVLAYPNPTGFVSTDYSGGVQAQLTWSDTNTYETGYRVLNGTTLLQTTAVDATGATIDIPELGVAYTLCVVAQNATGESATSECTSFTASAEPLLEFVGAATLDDTCLLSQTGTVTYDSTYAPTFAMAEGNIEGAGGGYTATASGISGTLTDLTPGRFQVSWVIFDSDGLMGWLDSRPLLRFAPGNSTTLTAQITPTLTIGDDAMEGRQPWSADSAPVSGVCEACTGGRASIALGKNHGCVLNDSGYVYCWGSNSHGQLGDEFAPDTHTLSIQPAVSGTVVALAAGAEHTCALTDNSKLSCWGRNEYGQLGTGDSGNNRGYPAQISSLDAVAAAAGVSHTCAVTTGGQVQCWGEGVSGQLGNDAMALSADPVTVVDVSSTALTDVVAVAAGGEHSCALTGSAGEVHCWGRGDKGQLGDCANSVGGTERPVGAESGCASNLQGIVAIAAGALHTCALTSTGTVKCWGMGSDGQLGNDDTADRNRPVDVCADAACLGSLTNVVAITAGAFHTCALIDDGTIKCWGDYAGGALGFALPAGDKLTPTVAVGLEIDGGGCCDGDLQGAAAVSAGGNFNCAVINDGRVMCWGPNVAGKLGSGNTDVDATVYGASGTCVSGTAPDCTDGSPFDRARFRGCGELEVLP